MPRVRWCASHSVLCLFIGVCSFWIVSVGADCWYDNDRYEEGAEVATAEPCLNCTCGRGALLCYLRMCPKLPNPPPPGCILLHRYRTCCPELICSEISGGGNSLEARSDPENGVDIPYDTSSLGNACVANGSIYAPGSAMDSSSLCEYCYCLGGKQTCVKPKCLLPTEGCRPTYDSANCCPVHYNCTSRPSTTTSSTTTVDPKRGEVKDGCMVDGILHHEGDKVLGVGHSICDNCYCLKGLLRCEPLSCAPPLLGCSPIIKSGECCAASYNCSGTIEIQPEPNYGQFPIVSKEYAKLRKEVNQKQPQNKEGVVTVAPFYVLAEPMHPSITRHRSPGSFGTTRHFTGIYNPSTMKPFYYNSMSRDDSGNKESTRNYQENKENFPGVYYATTNYEFQNTNYKRVFSTTLKPKPTESSTFKTINTITTTNYKEDKIKSPDYLGVIDDTIFSIFESLLDGRINRKDDNLTNNASLDIQTTTLFDSDTTEISTIGNSTDATDTTTSESISTTKSDINTSTLIDETSSEENTETDNFTTTELILSTTNSESKISYPITLKTILNSTDCIKNNDTLNIETSRIEVTTVIPVDANEINKLAELKTTLYDDIFTTTSEEISEETTTRIAVLENKVKIPTATLRNIPDIDPAIAAILNISKHKEEDYDYDYSEPSLPPSLPNVRIIPFVAADALDAKKDISKENILYPKQRVTDTSYGYSNLFSPPIETEGGFIPKDPPILDNFYENAVTTSSNDPKSSNVNCINLEGQHIVHSQPVPSESPCITCTCFYGNIVCQKPTCPIPRPECRKSSVQDRNLCCPQYICDEEAPTVVLDRLGITNSQEVVTVVEGILPADPFRDVIRTESAPNLQAFIGDMRPFLSQKTTITTPLTTEKTTQRPTHATTKNNEKDENEDGGFSLDKVLDLLFSGNKNEHVETTTNKIQTTQKSADELPVNSTNAPSITEKPNLIEVGIEDREDLNLNSNHPNSVDTPGVGILKLAGCNIYGRMYRVGRIISELSGPCLECKCTEIGVQCRTLKC